MTKQHPIERDVKNGVKKIFDKHKVFWWAAAAGAFSRSGISDFNAIWRGVFFAVEVKLDVKKNPPTRMQKAFLASVVSEAGMGFVVDADRLPLFDEFLTLFGAAAEAAGAGEPESVERSARLIDLTRALMWEVT